MAGNLYDKYHTRNPVARHLMAGYLRAFDRLFPARPGEQVLEMGCGEGYLLRHLHRYHPGVWAAGADLSLDILRVATRHGCPGAPFLQASAYQLPWRSASCDWVVACEVLEHLDRPEDALDEIRRVCRRGCLVSVPREPHWSLANLMRLRYLRRVGNTPGHVQRWGRHDFVELVDRYFSVEVVAGPFPWTLVRGGKR